MPEESTTSATPTPAPAEKPVEDTKVTFTLEPIDDDNVRKITSHPDVSIVNIPSMRKAKDDLEATVAQLQGQLDQINEVLFEYEKIKKV